MNPIASAALGIVYIKFILCTRLHELSSHNGLHTAGLYAVSLTVPVLFLELPMLVRTAPCVFISAH